MEDNEQFINPETTIKAILELENGYVIIGGPEDQIFGTLDFKTLLVWTTKEKADTFIRRNNINPDEDKVFEKPMLEILELARKLGFINLRFDFQVAGRHPNQLFVHYRITGQGILDSLPNFLSN